MTHSWEYHVEFVRGWFTLRTTKRREIQRICDTLGAQGWELVSVGYDWFAVEYTLFFKRPTLPNAREVPDA